MKSIYSIYLFISLTFSTGPYILLPFLSCFPPSLHSLYCMSLPPPLILSHSSSHSLYPSLFQIISVGFWHRPGGEVTHEVISWGIPLSPVVERDQIKASCVYFLIRLISVTRSAAASSPYSCFRPAQEPAAGANCILQQLHLNGLAFPPHRWRNVFLYPLHIVQDATLHFPHG